MKEEDNVLNPLLCDPAGGLCGTDASVDAASAGVTPTTKPLKITYFTDPICSACWGIEPQLRRLKLEYGHLYEIAYCLGGLLPSWEGFNGGGITRPADVAVHWDQASDYYQMPIDGAVWLEDPLDSSYPPSIAVKAAQLQGQALATAFLRRIRELLFLERRNITRSQHLLDAAKIVGLDCQQFTEDLKYRAGNLFDQDLALTAAAGVRGFPTLLISDCRHNRTVLNGYHSYEQFERTMLMMYKGADKRSYDSSDTGVFHYYPTLTTKEFALLTGAEYQAARQRLEKMLQQAQVGCYRSSKGELWPAR